MLGEKWKDLGDADRRPYEEKAAADKKRYEDEKANYNVSTITTHASFAMRQMLTLTTEAGGCRRR